MCVCLFIYFCFVFEFGLGTGSAICGLKCGFGSRWHMNLRI